MPPPQRLFVDRTPKPTLAQLKTNLGRRFSYWEEFTQHVAGPAVVEWKYYGKTIGWTMKLMQEKRNLCFMSPYSGFFSVAFVFGDRGVAAVEKSSLPAELIRELVRGRKYPEGRGIRIDVKSRNALDSAKMLLEIKTAF